MTGIVTFIGLLLLLWIGRSILIPLLIAAFLWYLMNAISDYYRKIFPYKNPESGHKNLSRLFNWISHIASFATLFLVGYLFVTQIKPMFSELVSVLPVLQEKLTQFGAYLSNSIGLKFDANMIPNISKIAANIGSSIASVAASMGMIVVYMIFMFIEQSTFNQKFTALFTNKRQSKKSRYILDSIDYNMKKYLQ